MKRLVTLIFTASIAFAGLYDYPYLENSNNGKIETETDKYLMYSDFDKIFRFEPIFFDALTNKINPASKDYLDEIVKSYEEFSDRNVTITIIGHTDLVETKTQIVNKSSWFTKKRNNLTEESSQEIAMDYAKYTQTQLTSKGIPESIIMLEQRGGLDNLYLGTTKEAKDLNHRAMIALYVAKSPLADDDNDRVINPKDKCQYTPFSHGVSPDGCSEILNLTIFYDHDSSKIRKVSFEKLKNMIEFLNLNPSFKVLLYGHASSEGIVQNNQILSQKRALSIRNYFVNQGIESSRISFYGKGSSEPLFSNDTEQGRQENRRVEVRLY